MSCSSRIADWKQPLCLQIEIFHETDADMVTAFTLACTEEAIGFARAAKPAGMPEDVGYTVETDFNLRKGVFQ